ATLLALGVPVENLAEVPNVLRIHQQELWQQGCQPVYVAWDGKVKQWEVRVAAQAHDGGFLQCQLLCENGEKKSWVEKLDEVPIVQHAEVEGVRYVARQLTVPEPVPLGYHRLRCEIAGHSFDSLLVSAPRRAFAWPGKHWGVFLPLYAAHSLHSWGAGDFTDLAALVDWVADAGGQVVATLPLLTAFLDEPFDPSPYAPASRLFWNEFYIDVTQVPELHHSPAAQALVSSPAFQREIVALQELPLVDYRRQMAVKRQVLAELVQTFFRTPGDRVTAFRDYIASHPMVEDYAQFRSVGERLRTSWLQWPQRLRDGEVQPADIDERARDYHLYVQWIAHEQLQEVSQRAADRDVHLYLDLPLGVHRDSYDVWRERAAFALAASGGAPPDAVYTKGQDWGFPPLHPERIRQQGYRYVRAYVRHHLRQAGVLRIDHVMGLHRLFWVPHNLEAKDGTYVSYPAEELYAILTLESHRHHAMIVGENLGTVPAQVNTAMTRHGIRRMYVVEYELPTLDRQPLRRAPAASVASVNTHDMPPLAAFWEGLDLQERLALGLMDHAGLSHERELHEARKAAFVQLLQRQRWLPEGEADLQEILTASLSFLAASPADLMIVNLEDLWLETAPQNVPGTGNERPNWQRKTRERFAVWSQSPQVTMMLRAIKFLRQRKRR
ncbi:MAG: 4-alpha-glucanotransferase, partial [Candidatus Binatia bacterium]